MIELGSHREHDVAAFGGPGARTAGELAGLAAAIARTLDGLAPGARVVLACQDRYYFGAGLLALWQRGLVALLPSNGQAETVRALAKSPGVSGLLHDRDDDVGFDVRTLEASAGSGPVPVRVTMPRQATAVIAYTSGSTGQPAAHEKTLAQLVDEPLALIEAFDLATKRVLASVPPHHLYGLLFGVLVPLLGRGATSRTSPLQPPEVLRELAAHDAQVLVAVPPHLGALAQVLRQGAGKFRTGTLVFSSGAPLPLATDLALRDQGVHVTQVLGSTETGGIAHRQKAGDVPWQPLPGVRIAVDAELLLVASPWSSPEPLAQVRTADRVELVEGGFRHLGRADQVVKIAGRRVDLGDVETKLRAVPGVHDARVVALEGSSLRGLELCAVVEVASDELTVQALRQALSRTLDPVTLPRRYRLVRQLPRTAAGKVNMDTLRSLFDVWELPREELEGGKLRFSLPANYGYFRGHFPDMPILPGVVQLEQLALRVSRERFPQLGALARLTRVKFKRPIMPGEQLVLGLELRSSTQVHFELRCNDAPAASGILHFRSTAP